MSKIIMSKILNQSGCKPIFKALRCNLSDNCNLKPGAPINTKEWKVNKFVKLTTFDCALISLPFDRWVGVNKEELLYRAMDEMINTGMARDL
jgi:hypothetical protein